MKTKIIICLISTLLILISRLASAQNSIIKIPRTYDQKIKIIVLNAKGQQRIYDTTGNEIKNLMVNIYGQTVYYIRVESPGEIKNFKHFKIIFETKKGDKKSLKDDKEIEIKCINIGEPILSYKFKFIWFDEYRKQKTGFIEPSMDILK